MKDLKNLIEELVEELVEELEEEERSLEEVEVVAAMWESGEGNEGEEEEYLKDAEWR